MAQKRIELPEIGPKWKEAGKKEAKLTLAQIQTNVLSYLRPLEAEKEQIGRDLIEALFSIRTGMRSGAFQPPEIQMGAINLMAQVMAAANAIQRNPSIAGEMAASLIYAAEGIFSYTIKPTKKQKNPRTVYLLTTVAKIYILKLLDSMVRAGTFFTGKLGLAYLSLSPLALWVSFDRGFKTIEDGMDHLATSQGQEEVLGAVSEEIAGSMGDYLLNLIRTQMAAHPFQAYGGSYAAPLTASGQLADAIGILQSGPLRRSLRGKGHLPLTHVVTVGLLPDIGRTSIYGNVLARAIPCRAPAVQYGNKVGFGKDAWGRFFAWGEIRGRSRQDVRRIAASIWRQGTYGRAWMAEIGRSLANIPTPRFLASSYLNNIGKVSDDKRLKDYINVT